MLSAEEDSQSCQKAMQTRSEAVRAQRRFSSCGVILGNDYDGESAEMIKVTQTADTTNYVASPSKQSVMQKNKSAGKEACNSSMAMAAGRQHRMPKVASKITCSNCATSNTPLWRRDPDGQPLCNACGLFFKLHGVVRPLSLKTDVIKKRNRGSRGDS